MCGRYATTRSAADLSEIFESEDETTGRLAPDWNVAPTDPVPVVRWSPRTCGRVLSVARWGLLPPWAKSAAVGARMINARAETVATTNAYAASFARRRCLVPADGWYEWAGRGAGRQAFYMTPRDSGVLAFAGLWSVWDGAGEPVLTCSIVTTAALGLLAEVHDRMPLVLGPERWADWLAGGGDPARLLAPPEEHVLAGIEIRPVGPAVGNVRNNGPELIARVDPVQSGYVEMTLF